MYQFKMNIDLNSLVEQLDDLAEVQDKVKRNLIGFSMGYSYTPVHNRREYRSLGGVLNLLGAIRDEVDKCDAESQCPYKVEPEEVKAREMTDRLAVGICEGFEVPLDDDEFIGAWQWMIDKHIAWTLQGSFGRIADRMIKSGVCKPAPEKSKIITPSFYKFN